ncbi:MAG: hypothetical protein WBD04_07030 [Candidatus Omnitrophota bacterium]
MKIEDLQKKLNKMSNKEKTRSGLLVAAIIILAFILIANYRRGQKAITFKKIGKKGVAVVERLKGPGVKKARKKKPTKIQAMLREVGREDPFLQPSERRTTVRPVRAELYLSGIVSDGRRSLAIINDMLVGEGDMIEDKKIIKIKSRSVVIRDGEREYTLRLGGFESQKGGK